MTFFNRLHRWFRNISKERRSTSTQDPRVNGPMSQVQFQMEKCPIPIVWLDTSVLFNLAMLRLGRLKDKVQENRLTLLRQSIYDLTRKGKLMCPRAGQPDEVWALRADFLDAFHELSLGIAMRPKAGIEEEQIRRLMTACIAKTRLVKLPYTDAFIDDPLAKFAQMLTTDYFVTVDGGLLGTIEQIQSQRGTIHHEWEHLRERLAEQGTTFDQQLMTERVGGIQAFPSTNRLVHAWDRLGGVPKGRPGVLAFSHSPYYEITPYVSINSALVAKLLTEKTRKIRHSDFMDVEHISSVLPYVDLMVVDGYMKSIVRGLGLDRKYNTTVCYIGDEEEILAFFKTVEESPVSVSPFPPFLTGEDPRRRS